MSDIDTKKGIKTIFDVFSDSDNKISMPAFYHAAKEVGNEEGGQKLEIWLKNLKQGGGKSILMNFMI